MKKVAYISGPITLGGVLDDERVGQFKQRFYDAEEFLANVENYEVINPCNCEEQASWEDYMKIHLPSVCRADVVVVLPAWEQSRGAMLEAFVASQLKIPVIPLHELMP